MGAAETAARAARSAAIFRATAPLVAEAAAEEASPAETQKGVADELLADAVPRTTADGAGPLLGETVLRDSLKTLT